MEPALAGYLLGSLVLVADQVVKYWVLHGLHLPDGHMLVLLPVLNFVLVWNHGITFGMFASAAARSCSPPSPPRSSSHCSSGSGAAITG